jgi:hypothetical protein
MPEIAANKPIAIRVQFFADGTARSAITQR